MILVPIYSLVCLVLAGIAVGIITGAAIWGAKFK